MSGMILAIPSPPSPSTAVFILTWFCLETFLIAQLHASPMLLLRNASLMKDAMDDLTAEIEEKQQALKELVEIEYTLAATLQKSNVTPQR